MDAFEHRDAGRGPGSWRETLLSRLAHELRNPLAAVRNASHLLASGPSDRELVVRAHEVIERQTESMTQLLDDALELAGAAGDHASRRREVVDLNPIVRQAVQETENFRRQARQEVELELPSTPSYVRADAALLERALRGMLLHLSRSASAEVPTWIQLHGGPRSSPWVVLRAGTGDALAGAPAAPPSSDEPWQSLAPAPGPGSDGSLSLSVARRLLELEGATLDVRSSRSRRGAEVVVRIPRVEHDEAAAPAAPPRAAHGGRVLIVEDDVDAGESQLAVLQQAGYEGRVVRDGASAVRAARELHPDVVLLDIDLPGADGYEVARRLRDEVDTNRTLLIALTGMGGEEEAVRSQQAGFHEHVTKPADQERLLRIVGRWRAITRGCAGREPLS